MKLDMRPRDYVPKVRNKPDKGGTQTLQPTSSVGTSSPSFRLQGFLLLGNTRNHCYANAVLQCVYWISAHVRDHMLREATRVSQLVRITPEHSALSTVTSGWHFDGGQHDAAEFLLRMSRNLAPHFQNSWETRKEVPEGVIVDEEGSLPIHIDVPLQDSLQQIICSWARREHTHTRCYHCQMSSVCHCLALPAGRRICERSNWSRLSWFRSSTPTHPRLPGRSTAWKCSSYIKDPLQTRAIIGQQYGRGTSGILEMMLWPPQRLH